MIVIGESVRQPSSVQFANPQEAFDMVDKHLEPLSRSSNKNDPPLYSRAKSAIGYFRYSAGLYVPMEYNGIAQITNGQFVDLIANFWGKLGIAEGKNGSGEDLKNRLELEDSSMRAMNKYNICYLGLYLGQTRYSIFGMNPEKLEKNLERVLMEAGKL